MRRRQDYHGATEVTKVTFQGERHMVAYEFNLRDRERGDYLIGILPERRKDTSRINEASIMNWGKMVLGRRGDAQDVYYVKVNIDK